MRDRWIAWVLITLWLLFTAMCLILSRPVHATTWFNPVPYTLVNGTTGLSAQVNADYNQIISDGNAANANLLAQIAALGAPGLPSTGVIAFNSTCPTGYAIADGMLGRPDARGLFIRGLDNGAGRDTNRVLGSFQTDQIQNHFHIAPSTFHTPAQVSLPANIPNIASANQLIIPVPPPTTGIMLSPVGGVETRPANIVLNYCINSVSNTNIFPFTPPLQLLSNVVVPDANIMMADYNHIISDGNAAFNALQAAITAIGAVTPIPPKAVMPFNAAVCPSGWIPADGTAGTIDMRARFARVTTGSPSVGTVQTDQFLDHTHTVPGSFIASFGIGTYNIVGPINVGTPFYTIPPSLLPITIIDVLATVTSGDGGANVGTETRPRNVALLYCQKS